MKMKCCSIHELKIKKRISKKTRNSKKIVKTDRKMTNFQLMTFISHLFSKKYSQGIQPTITPLCQYYKKNSLI